MEGVGDLDCGVEIFGVDSRGKIINGVVGYLEDFFFGVEFGDSVDGVEDFFLYDFYFGVDVGEDGGLDEVVFVIVMGIISFDCSVFVFVGFNVFYDMIILELRYLGVLEGFGVEWVVDFVCFSVFFESGDEFVVDVGLYVDMRFGVVVLVVVEVDIKVDLVDGLFDIGIVEDDIGRFVV